MSIVLKIAVAVVPALIKLFIRDRKSKTEALKRFQKWVHDRKEYAKRSKKIRDDYQRQKDAINKIEVLGEPDRPSISKKRYEVPTIVDILVKVDTKGKYTTESKKARGLVVHFTAGRSLNGKQDAINTLKFLASQGYGCMVMDKNGIIYKAKNQALDDVAWHAGKSKWKGRENISTLCMGMEICCAGKLKGNTTNFGLELPLNLIRKIKQGFDNIESGNYHKFTDEQEYALTNFILWQLDTNPEFSVDWIVGHAELAPNSKNVPGGSFSVSMPRFRNLLRNPVDKTA